MLNRLLIGYSACFLNSLVMPCNIRPQPQHVSLVTGILGIFGKAHDPRSLKLHVVPGCHFVRRGSLNHFAAEDRTRRFLFFCAYFFVKSAISIDVFGQFKICFVRLKIRSVFPLSRLQYVPLPVDLTCAS